MSTWFDQSNNANKLRQSYLKGFLDISGGGILVRNDNSLNFYAGNSGAVPEFALDATKIRVKNPSDNKANYNAAPVVSAGTAIDISAQKLGYLYNLEENVQATLNEFHDWKNASTDGISSSTVDASSVTVAADASIGGRLYVGGDITANGNLTLAKDLYVGGNVVVAGSQTVNMDFYVKGNTHLDGNLYAGSNFYLYSGSAFVNENITASGELNVVGKSYLIDDVSMSANLYVANTIYCNKIVVANDVSDNGTMEVAMDADLQSRLFVTGDVSLNSQLFVNGDASLNSTLRLGGDASLNSKLFVNGDASLNATFRLAGDASLNSKLFVHGDASMDAALTVGGAASLKSTLEVTGATTLKANTTIEQDLTVQQRLFVSGDASLNAKLWVNGETTIDDKLLVANDASLNAKLFVSGDASLNSNLSARDVSAGMFQAGRLIIEDNHNGVANMPNTIRSTEGNIVIRPKELTDWTIITSNLQVDGSINFTGSMVRTDTIVKVTEAFDVSNAGTRTALMVSQNAPNQDIAAFDNGDNTPPTFLVGRDNCVAINKTSVTANRHFDVSGNGYFSGIFDVTGAVTFHNNLDVSGHYLSTNGNLTLTNGKLTTKTLEVTTTSIFNGNVEMKSHLAMDAGKFIDQVGNEAW